MIYKYNQAAKNALKMQTEPQPWLHVGIADDTAVIFIWDTRQVVEIRKIGRVDAKLTPANDNGLPLQCTSEKWLNTALHLTSNTSIEQIRNLLKTLPEPKRTIACLKAIVRIWELGSNVERDGKRHTSFDGIGFSKQHLRPMGDVAKKLVTGKYALIGQDNINYAKNVAPMYAKQLAWLSNGDIRSELADSVERQLKRIL